MWLKKELVIFMRNFSFIHVPDSATGIAAHDRGLHADYQLIQSSPFMGNREKIGYLLHGETGLTILHKHAKQKF